MLSMIQSKALAAKNIAVAAAHPGWVKTDLGPDAAPMEVVDGASASAPSPSMSPRSPSRIIRASP